MFKRPSCLVIACFIVFALIFIGSILPAPLYPSFPHDFSINLPNDELVFVMLVPDHIADESSLFSNTDASIRNRYPSSGLYTIESPPELLWDADWYSYDDDIQMTSNGKYLVRLSVDPEVDNNRGITFYENGEQINRYPISNLTMPSLVGDNTNWRPSLEISEDERIASLSNQNGSTFEFDVQTGELESGNWLRARNMTFSAVWLVVVLSIFVGIPLYSFYRLIRFFYRRIRGA